jgi:hypothetical protein
VGACEKRREDGARSLTNGTTPTAARVNMRCRFWRDLSPIGAKWALFPGLSCTWNGLREEIAYFGRYNSPSAKFVALLPNLVCYYLPSSQGRERWFTPPHPTTFQDSGDSHLFIASPSPLKEIIWNHCKSRLSFAHAHIFVLNTLPFLLCRVSKKRQRSRALGPHEAQLRRAQFW